MLTEAEARAYVTDRLGLVELCNRETRRHVFEDGRPGWSCCSECFQHEEHGLWCHTCHGTGMVALPWHVWEELIPAMEGKSFRHAHNAGGFAFWRKPDTSDLVSHFSPIIAAALALQQEASDE